MSGEFDFYTVFPAGNSLEAAEIRSFLASCQLEIDSDIDIFVVARQAQRLVACAGLSTNVIKCVAISPDWRGESLSLQLVSEIVQLAAERNQFHLFLYARPCNVPFFSACGFYPLVEVPDTIVLMENSPVAIQRYCQGLQQQRQPGAKTGCIVMNANPFTLGHKALAQQAAQACDWLHVFVVREDASLFRYADRFNLVAEGLRGISNLTVHHGSDYMISRATFPGYFLKDQGIIDRCHTAIDLLLFRDYIAPALNITHRFVGTEPFCQVTRKYNEDMKYWLQHAPTASTPVEVVEVPRVLKAGSPISASAVRQLLEAGNFERIRTLVPDATLHFLQQEYTGQLCQLDHYS